MLQFNDEGVFSQSETAAVERRERVAHGVQPWDQVGQTAKAPLADFY